MSSFHKSVYVHPSSVQIGRVTVGEHSSLWPCSSIRADYESIVIGRYSSVQDCCVLHVAPGASISVGDFVTVAHGAVLHGCRVEDNCLIGMNATVLDHAIIGEGSLVAAGALVKQGTEVPPGSFVSGTPARVMEGRPGQRESLRSGAISYAALAEAYLEGKQAIEDEELKKRMSRLEQVLTLFSV